MITSKTRLLERLHGPQPGLVKLIGCPYSIDWSRVFKSWLVADIDRDLHYRCEQCAERGNASDFVVNVFCGFNVAWLGDLYVVPVCPVCGDPEFMAMFPASGTEALIRFCADPMNKYSARPHRLPWHGHWVKVW